MEERFKFSNLSEFMDAFPSEKYCIEYLEKKRWPNGVVSPYDPTSTVYRRHTRGDGQYRCGNTQRKNWYDFPWLIPTSEEMVSCYLHDYLKQERLCGNATGKRYWSF